MSDRRCGVVIILVALVSTAGCGREGASSDEAVPAIASTAPAAPAIAPRVKCIVAAMGQDPIGPGLPIMWDGSLHCPDAPPAGVGEGIVTFRSMGVELELTGVRILKATPKPLLKLTQPRGAEPAPIRVTAAGLPMKVMPGPPTPLPIAVHYTLTADERGFANANLHVIIDARILAGPGAGETVEIPLIVHVRGKGADVGKDEDDPPQRGGRPDKPGDAPGD